MRFNASQFRRVSLMQAVVFGAALQIVGVSACASESDPTVGESADNLKGGNGKNNTNKGKHMGQAGSAAHGNAHADGGVGQDHGNQGKGMGSQGGQGQGQGHAHAAAGAPADATHGKSGQAHAGSHAQGPKAGHGADDMDDQADETP